MIEHTFIVTKDHIEDLIDEDDDHGRWPFEIGEGQPKGWEPFELYDDDRELYFEGYADEDKDGFYDAWNWGAWFAGCTLLKSRGEWVIG